MFGFVSFGEQVQGCNDSNEVSIRFVGIADDDDFILLIKIITDTGVRTPNSYTLAR